MGSDERSGKGATVNERILLHLREHAIGGEKGDYPPALTQEGIADAIGIRTNHVPRAVRRLSAEGLVEERTAHVSGFARRRKVYLLTQDGTRVAEDIVRRLLESSLDVLTADGKRESLKPGEISKRYADRPGLTRILRAQGDDGVVRLSRLEGAVLTVGGRVDFSDRFHPPEQFFGRERELARLRGFVASPEIKTVVISGIKGVGKSALAHRSAQESAGARHVFWHTCHGWDDPLAILSSLSEFLAAAGKGRLKAAVSKKGTSTAGLAEIAFEDFAGMEALVVLDNLFELDEKSAEFCAHLVGRLASHGGVRCVVTTRDPRMAERLRAEELRLEGMDRESALALYESFKGPEGEFDRVFALTGGHPLAIELIASGEVSDPEDEEGLTPEERVMMRSLRAFDIILH